ncbi:hypothetical protein [Pandoraea anhela]|uniref:Translocation protein in type III secretion n=1 Tax=Pandoraea anhela TaxID=2508295 RepID=A0A5E4YJI7_9BURK|nr:hypothetical protein [Pandoraea anhela]VVE48697.1 translocation protein in type III secretion [Pandoraea anhela]
MSPETDVGSGIVRGASIVAGSLDDVLAGHGCLTFAEGDIEVRVGWLRIGGEGLVVTAHVDDGVAGEVRFWCDAQQWIEWLSPSLPVPSWDALPPAWQASAASLTFATQSPEEGTSDAESSLAPWPRGVSVMRERVETTWRMGMVLRRGGRQLALPYLDGMTSWLQARCRHASPCEGPLDPSGFPERRCVMAVGWAALPASMCDGLLDGGAVLLDVAADVTSGEYWLIDGDDAIAMRDGQPAGRHVVALDTAGESIRQAGAPGCIRLVAVIAERQVPVPWLTAWRNGQITPPPPTTHSALTVSRLALWRDGVPWTDGCLLRFGDGRLAVKIDHTPEPPTDATSRSDSTREVNAIDATSATAETKATHATNATHAMSATCPVGPEGQSESVSAVNTTNLAKPPSDPDAISGRDPMGMYSATS